METTSNELRAIGRSLEGVGDIEAFVKTAAGAEQVAELVVREIEAMVLLSASEKKRKESDMTIPFDVGDQQTLALETEFPGMTFKTAGTFPVFVSDFKLHCAVVVEMLIDRISPTAAFELMFYGGSFEHSHLHSTVTTVLSVEDVAGCVRAQASILGSVRETVGEVGRSSFTSFSDNPPEIMASVFDGCVAEISLAQIAYTMNRHREVYSDGFYIPEGYLIVPFSKEVLCMSSGSLKAVGLEFRKTATHIRFYSTDVCIQYEWATYKELVTTAFYVSKDVPDVVFSVEQFLAHSNLFVARVVGKEKRQTESMEMYRGLHVSDHPDMLVGVVRMRAGRLVNETVLVDRAVYDRVYSIVIGISAAQFTLDTVRSKLRLSQEVVIVRGRTFRLSQAMDMEDLAAVAAAIYVHAFVQRFEATQAMTTGLERMLSEVAFYFQGGATSVLTRLLVIALMRGSGVNFFVELVKSVSAAVRSLGAFVLDCGEMHIEELPKIYEVYYDKREVTDRRPSYPSRVLPSPKGAARANDRVVDDDEWTVVEFAELTNALGSEIAVIKAAAVARPISLYSSGESHIGTVDVVSTLGVQSVMSDAELTWSVQVVDGRPVLSLVGLGDVTVPGYWCARNYCAFNLRALDDIGDARELGDVISRQEGDVTIEVLIARVGLSDFKREYVPFPGLYESRISHPEQKGLASFGRNQVYFNSGCISNSEGGFEPTSDICFISEYGGDRVTLFGREYSCVLNLGEEDHRMGLYVGEPHGLGVRLQTSLSGISIGFDISAAGYYKDVADPGLWHHLIRSWDEAGMSVTTSQGAGVTGRYELVRERGLTSVMFESRGEMPMLIGMNLAGCGYNANVQKFNDARHGESPGPRPVLECCVTRLVLPEFGARLPGSVALWTLSSLVASNWFGMPVPRRILRLGA